MIIKTAIRQSSMYICDVMPPKLLPKSIKLQHDKQTSCECQGGVSLLGGWAGSRLTIVTLWAGLTDILSDEIINILSL